MTASSDGSRDDVGVDRVHVGGPQVQPVDTFAAHHREQLDPGLFRRRCALGEQRGGRDQHGRLRIGQHEADLPGHQQGVHGYHHGAQGQRRVVDPGEVGDVGHQYRDAVSGPDALLREHRGIPSGLLPQLRVADPLRPDHHRIPLRVPHCGLGQDRCQRQAHGRCTPFLAAVGPAGRTGARSGTAVGLVIRTTSGARSSSRRPAWRPGHRRSPATLVNGTLLRHDGRRRVPRAPGPSVGPWNRSAFTASNLVVSPGPSCPGVRLGRSTDEVPCCHDNERRTECPRSLIPPRRPPSSPGRSNPPAHPPQRQRPPTPVRRRTAR